MNHEVLWKRGKEREKKEKERRREREKESRELDVECFFCSYAKIAIMKLRSLSTIQKAHIVGMHEAWKTSSWIRKELDIIHQTISNVLKTYQHWETLVFLKPLGRLSKLKRHDKVQLILLVCELVMDSNLWWQFKSKWVKRLIFVHCKNILRDLATTTILYTRSHFSTMYKRHKDWHLLELMNIGLFTNGRMSSGLTNMFLRLASTCSWYEFGINHMKDILHIVCDLLSSLVAFLSWYGALSMALINLP